MSKREFTARLESVGPNGAWTFLTLPFDAAEAFGSKGRISVTGMINGCAFRSSIFPNGDGTHSLMVNKAMQKGAGAAPGDTVTVVMEADTAPRTVTVPDDLATGLASHPAAQTAFEKLSYSHKKAYLDWIKEAKKAETRARRVEKTLEMLVEGRRLNM